jgi:hypothetical protein
MDGLSSLSGGTALFRPAVEAWSRATILRLRRENSGSAQDETRSNLLAKLVSLL